MPEPLRLLFLGDRRISWEALKHLASPAWRDAFDLRGLVTSPDIEAHYTALTGEQPQFITNASRRTQAILDCIRDQQIDVLLSIQYNWILPASVLDAVQRRAFNLHNAKLPDYKGYNSIAHAIHNGDTVYESTLHWMADEVDSGDIAYVGLTPIRPDDTARSLYERSVDGAMDAFVRLLADLKAGRSPPRRPMQTGAGVFYQRDSAAELADLTGVVDPVQIERTARAAYFPPVQTAWRQDGGERRPVLPARTVGAAEALVPANAPLYA